MPNVSPEPALLPANAARTPRDGFIDSLRGLSIFAVMCVHLGLPAWTTHVFPSWTTRVIGSAYYFVTVFFTVSGFLIASTSIRRFRVLGSIDIGEFVIFRAARIFPFLLLVLTLLVSLGTQQAKGFAFSPGLSLSSGAFAALAFQFNSWFLAHLTTDIQAWGVMWSLSIEEIFYGVFPVLCVLLRAPKALVFWLLFSVPLALYVRSTDGTGLYLATGCMDAMAVGVLVALLGQRPRASSGAAWTRWLPYLGMAAGLALILFVCQHSLPTANAVFGPLLCSVGTGLYLFASTRVSTARLRRRPWWRLPACSPAFLPARLGQASYEAYLLHLPIKLLIVNYVWQEVDTFVVIGVVGAISYGLNRSFTEPVNRIIRGWLSSRGGHDALTSLRGLAIPALVGAALLLVPSALVRSAPPEASSVRSVSLTIHERDLTTKMEPVIVYGAAENAEFLSVTKLADGSLVWQFDHWGSPSIQKPTARVRGDKVVVVLDCAAPSVSIDGTRVFTAADLPGFASHGEVSLGRNDVGGSTMERAYSGRIDDVTIELDTGRRLHRRRWKGGVLR